MARFKQTGKPKPAPCKPANQPITKQEAQAVAKRLASLGKSLTRSVKKTVHTVRRKSARFSLTAVLTSHADGVTQTVHNLCGGREQSGGGGAAVHLRGS